MTTYTRLLAISAILLAPVAASAQTYDDYGQSSAAPYGTANPQDDQSGYNGNDQASDPSGQDDQQPRHHRHAGSSIGLTPDQQAAWKADMRRQVQDMPRDQRRAYRQQMRAQFLTMSPQERQQKLASLQNGQPSYAPNNGAGYQDQNGNYQNDDQNGDDNYQPPRRHRHHQANNDPSQDTASQPPQDNSSAYEPSSEDQQYGQQDQQPNDARPQYDERQYGQSRRQVQPQQSQSDNNDNDDNDYDDSDEDATDQ